MKRRGGAGAAAAMLGAAAIALLGTGCSDRPAPLTLDITHALGGTDLQLGVPAAGDGAAAPTVTRLSYYLGRVRLQRDDGRWFGSKAADTPAGDYVLVDASDARSQHVHALDVPAGRYRTLEFLLGVDAAQNRAGPQAGALDPAHGMFWTWRSGYIFFALEGRSPRSPEAGGALTFHIGGDPALARTVVLPLPGDGLTVADDRHPAIHLYADLDALFDGLPLETLHTVTSAKGADAVADRAGAMFRVDHVHADEPDAAS